MKRTEAMSIGDVLRLTVQECNMTQRLDEQKAIAMWSRVVGDMLASQCRRPVVKAGVMTVSVPAAPLRHELTMNRSALLRHINDALGRDVISEIRFV